ncbi:MAG: transcriptional repressor LexA [Armatimonadota bacterium]|jgi:repressor LexA
MTRGIPLSPKRREILDYIERHTQRFGYPPTVREIGEAVRLSSPSTVQAHLKRLAEEGLIVRERGLTRAIRPARPALRPAKTVQLPLVGRVAAGTPLLAEQDIEGYFGVPSELVPDGRGFLLSVRGDSMVEAGIHDGDYVVVREQPSADDGDIVVALVDGEGTVKRLHRENGRIRLQPANQKMQPIYADDVRIVGKVVGLFRRLQ